MFTFINATTATNNENIIKEDTITMITKEEIIEAMNKFYVYINSFDKSTGTGVIAQFDKYVIPVCGEKYKNTDTLNYILSRTTNETAQDIIITLNTLKNTESEVETYNKIMQYLYKKLNKTLKEDTTMKFEDESTNCKLNNPYFVYEIGDIFHNSNGDDYIIIGLNEEKDKALLVKKLNNNDHKHTKALYIGAKGLNMHSWCHGHYFMENVEAAFEWFNKDNEEPKGLTIEEFVKLNVEWQDNWFFIHDDITDITYKFKGIEIPQGFLRSHIVDYIVLNSYLIEEEVNIPIIQINFNSDIDDVNMEIMNVTFENKRI